jgi:hypothetical protein
LPGVQADAVRVANARSASRWMRSSLSLMFLCSSRFSVLLRSMFFSRSILFVLITSLNCLNSVSRAVSLFELIATCVIIPRISAATTVTRIFFNVPLAGDIICV